MKYKDQIISDFGLLKKGCTQNGRFTCSML
jgi:hypothetical protein